MRISDWSSDVCSSDLVDGKGFERLRAAGVQVQSGLMEAQARVLNRGFLSRIGRGRPWLRIKRGSSLDGRTAMANGDPKWITGAAARAVVMHWRARRGAILTDPGPVLTDDPQLTRPAARSVGNECASTVSTRRASYYYRPKLDSSHSESAH